MREGAAHLILCMAMLNLIADNMEAALVLALAALTWAVLAVAYEIKDKK